MGNVAKIQVVELLVPGLGPVDQEALLRPTANIGRISGDDKAGLYRSGVDLRKMIRPAAREVYDWTRLTIGGASRALWLFLMPFLLVNLVAWMQPRWPSGIDEGWRRKAGAVYEFCARLLALSLTVLVVGSVGQLAMDQFAWQCHYQGTEQGKGVCAADNPAVTMLLDHAPDPGAALVLACVLPFLVVFVLRLAARDTKQEYLPVLETVTEAEAEEARRRRSVTGEDGHPLELPGFWEYNRRDPGMAAQHVWAGLLTTAMLLTWTPLDRDMKEGGPQEFGWALLVVIGTMTVITLLSVPWLHRHVHITLPTGSRRRRWINRLPYVKGKVLKADGRADGTVDHFPLWPTHYPVPTYFGCVVVNVAAVLYCLLPDRDWRVGGELPGIPVQATAVLLVQAGGVCVLLVTSLLLPKWGTRRHMALYGLAGPAMAVLACFVGWLYTTGFALWSGSSFARDGRRPDLPQPVDVMGMALPLVLFLGALGWVVMLAGVWFVGLARPDHRTETDVRGLRRLLHGVRSLPSVVSRSLRTVWSDSRLETDDRRHLHEVRAARRKHDYLLREMDWMIGTTAVSIVVVAVLFYVPLRLESWLRNVRDLSAGVLGSLSIPLLAGLAGLMLLAFRTLAMRPDMRQNAGLAWAFGAFWPRAVHPFAPPPWTVRAVPELVHRLRVLLKPPNQRVLIRANSMGAVLVLAAVWQLEPDRRERIALLTTGSPVGTFFARNYPAFVCVESIRALAPCGAGAKLAGWTNVWRDTDPLGGPVGIEGVDRRWPDDSEGRRAHKRRAEEPVFPPIEGHRGYTTDKRLVPLRNQLMELLLELPPPAAPPGAVAAEVVTATAPGT